MGLLILLTTTLIGGFRLHEVRQYALAGALAGVAVQLHGSLIAVPASLVLFFLGRWREVRTAGQIAFAVVGLAVVAPWGLWSLRHFDIPFYSYAPHVLWIELGAAQEGIYGDVVTWRWTGAPVTDILGRVVRVALDGASHMVGAVVVDAGPTAPALAGLGLAVALRRAPRRAAEQLLPAALYLALVLTQAYRDRFAVALLPVVYLTAGAGAGALWDGVTALGIARVRWRRGLALLLVAAAIAWMAPLYFESPPTRYYARDTRYREWYEHMRPIARGLSALPRGATLGYALSLDGGLEAVYWHRQPFVRGTLHGPPREESKGETLQKLARDFDVRYLWADAFTVGELRALFPEGRVRLGNERFYVLELPAPHPAGDRASSAAAGATSR
jgi:hypothetical protein